MRTTFSVRTRPPDARYRSLYSTHDYLYRLISLSFACLRPRNPVFLRNGHFLGTNQGPGIVRRPASVPLQFPT